MRRFFVLTAALTGALLLAANVPAGVQFGERAEAAVGWDWMEQANWRTSGHTRAKLGGLTVRNTDSVRDTSYACAVRVAAVEEGRPSELELRFDAASLSEDGEETQLDLAGAAFQAAGLGDDRTFRTDEGKRVKRKPRRFLEQQFGDQGDDGEPLEILLPESAVSVGDTWPLGMDRIVERLGKDRFVLDEAASSATGTLTAVTERDGIEYGTIQFAIVIVPSEITDGTFTEARMELQGTAELPLLGATPYQAVDVTVDIDFLGTVSRHAVTVDLDLDLQTVGSVTLAKL
ncbi:MAG: hypothetical protein GY898_01645 [Proteobacteria bacterium]|nr:hypothetical protein [Pseudomonadota bacterium]